MLFGRFGRSTTAKVFAAVMISVAISVPVSVWAVTTFTDVPASHPFYGEISAVAGAGIAQGFNDGTYRPSNSITRQAMAAFMERGVGRAVADHGTSGVRTSLYSEIATVALDGGATGVGTNGFVVLSASLHASTNASTTANCPCSIALELYDRESSLVTSFMQVPRLANGEEAIGVGSVQAVVPVDGDATRVYRLMALGSSLFDDGQVTATGSIVATYVPLSGDGDSTSEYGLTCPKNDPWEQNDTLPAASRYFMVSGQPTSAIVCPGDLDWYADNVEDDWTIMVNLTFDSAEGNIDVCLHNVAGIALECSTGSGNTETITYPSASAGAYFIRVYLQSDSGSSPGNTYTLTATKTGTLL